MNIFFTFLLKIEQDLVLKDKMCSLTHGKHDLSSRNSNLLFFHYFSMLKESEDLRICGHFKFKNAVTGTRRSFVLEKMKCQETKIENI
jgi:hypothetical protein